MAKKFEGELYLDVDETAALTERKRSTILQRWRKNNWQPMWLGRKLYFRKSQVISWMTNPDYNMKKNHPELSTNE